jgi:CHASE3 domain sensor protein
MRISDRIESIRAGGRGRLGPKNRITVGWHRLGLALGVLFFLISAATAYLNLDRIKRSDVEVRRTHAVLNMLDDLFLGVLDAETGQRGYLLTGREDYLGPYVQGTRTARQRLKSLAPLARRDAVQNENFILLQSRVERALDILAEAVATQRNGNADAALAALRTDRGKAAMDGVRSQVARMANEELRIREMRLADMAAASRTAIASSVITSTTGVALTIAIFVLLGRNNRSRERQQWLQTAQVELAQAMLGREVGSAIGVGHPIVPP